MGIVGHWSSVAEANKLTQSELLAGIVQEIYESGQLIQRLPVTGIDSLSLKWNREKTLPVADFYDTGDVIPWTSDVEYADQTEFTIKQIIRQDPIDEKTSKNYRNVNDYKAILTSQLSKGCLRTMENYFIYGDIVANPKAFDGFHRLISATQAVDAAETAGSLIALKRVIRMCKPRPDFLLMSPVIWDRLSWAQQFGIADSNNSRQQVAGFAWDKDDFGASILKYDGVPLWPSDYMVAENANSGVIGTGTRSKHNTGTAQYSILAIRLGQIEDGGTSMLVGAETGGPQFFDYYEWPKLENYAAGGIRLTAYSALANGSTKSISGYYDLTDAAFTF